MKSVCLRFTARAARALFHRKHGNLPSALSSIPLCWNFDMMVVLSPTPTATPGFWRSCIRKIRSSPAINSTGDNISPCSTPLVMSNGSESVIVPSGCLRRTTQVATAKIACTMRRTLATHCSRSKLVLPACLPEESSV